jgi:hypothetical protein
VLYVAVIHMKLPGNTPEDAAKRLASKLPPGWEFEIQQIEPAPNQPDALVGEGHIRLPLMGVKAG